MRKEEKGKREGWGKRNGRGKTKGGKGFKYFSQVYRMEEQQKGRGEDRAQFPHALLEIPDSPLLVSSVLIRDQMKQNQQAVN